MPYSNEIQFYITDDKKLLAESSTGIAIRNEDVHDNELIDYNIHNILLGLCQDSKVSSSIKLA